MHFFVFFYKKTDFFLLFSFFFCNFVMILVYNYELYEYEFWFCACFGCGAYVACG